MDPETSGRLLWFQGELVEINHTHVGGQLESADDVLLSGGGGFPVWLERNRPASGLPGGCFPGGHRHLFPGSKVVRTAFAGNPGRDFHAGIPGFEFDTDV